MKKRAQANIWLPLEDVKDAKTRAKVEGVHWHALIRRAVRRGRSPLAVYKFFVPSPSGGSVAICLAESQEEAMAALQRYAAANPPLKAQWLEIATLQIFDVTFPRVVTWAEIS